MKVSKKSWHYRLLHQTMEGCPEFEYNNLCSYFWAVVSTLIVKIPIIIFLALILVVTSPIWGVVCLGFYLYDRRDRRLRKSAGLNPWQDWPEPEKEPSLLRAWLRAKKEKVCPMIEYED